MAFEGFHKDGMGFFRMLAIQQDRDWFKSNKAAYDELWVEPMKALLDELKPVAAKIYRGLPLSEPKIFRIHRDVRFSKDKTPYKTSVSGVISLRPRAGAMEGGAALYLQLGLEEVGASGHWMFEPATLVRYRKLLDADKTGRELGKRVAALEKKGFVASAMDSLKRVPKGFDPEHPRAALLKHKGLGLEFPKIPASVRHSRKLAGWLADQMKQTATVTSWLEAELFG